MTTFEFRPGTIDGGIYRSVTEGNEYRLPDHFEADDVILDIGAHIGSFSFAVLERGSRRVVAVEAEAANYAAAVRHLDAYIRRGDVRVIHGAVWRSDPNDDRLSFSGYPLFDDRHRLNTGGGNVWTASGPELPKLAFDDLVTEVAAEGRRVRLIKLDCEGSEWPILYTSRTLHLVDEICGEFHELGTFATSPSYAHDLFSRWDCSPAALSRFLTAAGFRVSWHSHRDQYGRLAPLGLFFASR